jgi:hypothetical protein
VLTVHIGMPKTGTTALQGYLSDHAAALAQAGVHYPIEFCGAATAQHGLIVELLERQAFDGPLLTRFKRYLEDHAGASVLISSEAFTNALTYGTIDVLMAWLADCRAITPVRLVMALRRIDTFFESMYLHQTKFGSKSEPIAAYTEARLYWCPNVFAQIARLQNGGLADEVRLLKYASDAAFQPALLAAMGIDPQVTAALPEVPRVGEKLGFKAQSLLYELDRHFGRHVPDVERRRIIRAFQRRELRFTDDTRDYTVLDRYVELFFRENALRAALQCGVTQYVDYFAADPYVERAVKTLSLDCLTRDDLEALERFLRG